MTREEALDILTHNWTRVENPNYDESELDKAYYMAIEALREPKTIIGIDTPYGSDTGIATIFKGKDGKLILEDIKEIMSVVRCKDCRHKVTTKDGEYNPEDIVCDYWATDGLEETDFCSYGERKGGGDE